MDDSDDIPAGIEIYSIQGGRYTHSIHVDREFFGLIKGRGSQTLHSIQYDTKTRIAVPRIGEDGDIVINGSSRSGVLSARNRITAIVKRSQKKTRYTHFLAVPMTDESIAANYDKFRKTVLNETGKDSKGVSEEIFQKKEKMHLTLGMLVLLDDNAIQEAIKTLEECKKEIILPITEKHGAIKIQIRGLGNFDQNPANSRVLYGLVSTDNDVLQELTEKMAVRFKQKGLMGNEDSKLHLTLMNTSFAKDTPRRIIDIDATNIMKVHKDYHFGESVMSTVQICHLGPRAEDGYYTVTSKINLVDG